MENRAVTEKGMPVVRLISIESNEVFYDMYGRSQCYFQGRPELLEEYLRVPKRSIVVSNTNEKNFVRALGYQVEKEPEILFLSAKKYGKKSIDGDILTNVKAVEDITEFVSVK